MELPNGLIPFNNYEQFIDAQAIENETYFISTLHSLVFCLPSTHRVVLQFIVSFFQSLVDRCEVNQMTVEKVAAVVGPLIVRPPLDAKPVPDFLNAHPRRNEAAKIFAAFLSSYTLIFLGEESEIRYIMKDGNQVVKSGKLDKLVEKLVDDIYNEAGKNLCIPSSSFSPSSFPLPFPLQRTLPTIKYSRLGFR
jgi:hypothetical protein